MALLEFILIFAEEIFFFVLKIKYTIIRDVLLTLLVGLISLFVVSLIYVTIMISLSSAPWYIKLLLVSICIPCTYVVFQIMSNGYEMWKQVKNKSQL